MTARGAVLYRAGRSEVAVQRLARADGLVQGRNDPALKFLPVFIRFSS